MLNRTRRILPRPHSPHRILANQALTRAVIRLNRCQVNLNQAVSTLRPVALRNPERTHRSTDTRLSRRPTLRPLINRNTLRKLSLTLLPNPAIRHRNPVTRRHNPVIRNPSPVTILLLTRHSVHHPRILAKDTLRLTFIKAVGIR